MSVPTKKLLSEKNKRFCVAFVAEAKGNATKAAQIAGYSKASARFQGSKLLRDRNIQAYIATLTQHAEEQAVEDAGVASAAERRELLTKIARSADMHPLARLKAVDIHNKMDGLYIQKHEISGKLTLEQVLEASRSDGASA